MFKFTLTDSETYNRGTGYGKTVRPVLRGDRWSNPLFYLNLAVMRGDTTENKT